MITTLPSPEQQQIVDSVIDVLRSRCSVDRLRDSQAAPGATEAKEWALFAEMGWFGIGLPESVGGIDCSILEEVLAFREIGREALSPTVLATCLAGHAAWQSGNAELAATLVAGTSKVALAVPAGPAGEHTISPVAMRGEFYIIDRMDAEHVLVWSDDGVALISLADAGLATAVAAIDTTVAFAQVSLTGAVPSIFLEDKGEVLRNRASLLVTAVLVGMAEASCTLAVEYAKVREQFGKPIGSFQAIAHHCANMAARAEAAWIQTKFAALAFLGEREDTAFQIPAAYLLAAEAASVNSAISVRVHGAMGFTAECSVHHFVKRSVLFKAAGGSPHRHVTALLQQPAAA